MLLPLAIANVRVLLGLVRPHTRTRPLQCLFDLARGPPPHAAAHAAFAARLGVLAASLLYRGAVAAAAAEEGELPGLSALRGRVLALQRATMPTDDEEAVYCGIQAALCGGDGVAGRLLVAFACMVRAAAWCKRVPAHARTHDGACRARSGPSVGAGSTRLRRAS